MKEPEKQNFQCSQTRCVTDPFQEQQRRAQQAAPQNGSFEVLLLACFVLYQVVFISDEVNTSLQTDTHKHLDLNSACTLHAHTHPGHICFR
jgi:hypothetical protein